MDGFLETIRRISFPHPTNAAKEKTMVLLNFLVSLDALSTICIGNITYLLEIGQRWWKFHQFPTQKLVTKNQYFSHFRSSRAILCVFIRRWRVVAVTTIYGFQSSKLTTFPVEGVVTMNQWLRNLYIGTRNRTLQHRYLTDVIQFLGCRFTGVSVFSQICAKTGGNCINFHQL